ncbi:type II secretion system protein M [bacterium SCSIO 12696]|nr:type II secretion system protein M [bacterium SCSIO 12696]
MANWQQFDRREQGVLLFGGIAVVLILLWWLLIQPMLAMVDKREANNRLLSAQLQEATQLAGQIKSLKATNNPAAIGSNNLMRLVSQSARSFGLGLSNFTPNSDGSVSLRFEQAAFNGFMQWLSEMESQHSATVDNLSVTPTGDSGVVKVSVRLRGNG